MSSSVDPNKMNKTLHRSYFTDAQLHSILRVSTVHSLTPNSNELAAKKRWQENDYKSREHIQFLLLVLGRPLYGGDDCEWMDGWIDGHGP